MRRKVTALLTAALLALAVWMLWPRSLAAAMNMGEGDVRAYIIRQWVELRDHTSIPQSEVTPLVLEKGDPVLEELEEILSRYRYHLCWDSLLGRASIEGGGSSETFWLYVGKDRDLSTLGGKDVILNGRTVRIDYWGSNDGLTLCQEVVACLKSAAEADAE